MRPVNNAFGYWSNTYDVIRETLASDDEYEGRIVATFTTRREADDWSRACDGTTYVRPPSQHVSDGIEWLHLVTCGALEEMKIHHN
jgi:hypothetical protein